MKYYNWSSLEPMKVKSYLKNSCSRNVARLATKFEKIDSKLMLWLSHRAILKKN